MLTVEKLLTLPSLKGLDLATSQSDLTKEITGVNILDNPDAADWLSTGELLITSGYFFSQTREIQERYLRHFKEINCSAVALKPHAYFSEFPQQMIDFANKIGLTIILVPYKMPFSKIMTITMAQLSGTINHLTQTSLDIHSQLFNIALHGGGSSKLIHALSEIVDNPIAFVDQHWVLKESTVNAALLIQELFINSHDEKVFPKELLHHLPKDFAHIQKAIARPLTYLETELICTVMPIYFDQVTYGFIIVFQKERSLNAVDQIALENCAMSLALERVKSLGIEQTTNRVKRDFLLALLNGEIKNSATLASYDTRLNEDLNYSILIFTIRSHAFSEKSSLAKKQYEEQLIKNLRSSLLPYMQQQFTDFYIISQKDQFIMLKGYSKEETDGHITSQLTREAKKIIHFMQAKEEKLSLFCSIGPTTSLFETAISYEKAQETKQFLDKRELNQTIFFYRDFFFDAFIADNLSASAKNKLIDYFLADLIDNDNENKSALIETLTEFLINQQNIAVTSRNLFIHRNTLLYRLDKIKEILNVSLEDPTASLALNLALFVYRQNN